MEELTQFEIVKQRKSDFTESFTGEKQGRTLAYLSKFCLENRSTFLEDSARKSDFNEGARSVILEIRHWLDIDLSKIEKD